MVHVNALEAHLIQPCTLLTELQLNSQEVKMIASNVIQKLRIIDPHQSSSDPPSKIMSSLTVNDMINCFNV